MKEFVADLRAQQEQAIAEAARKQEEARQANELKSMQDALAAEKQQLVATLQKLKELEAKAAGLEGASFEVSAKTRGAKGLKRHSTIISLDPGTKEAIKSALNDIGDSPGGRAALHGLLRKRSSQSAPA